MSTDQFTPQPQKTPPLNEDTVKVVRHFYGCVPCPEHVLGFCNLQLIAFMCLDDTRVVQMWDAKARAWHIFEFHYRDYRAECWSKGQYESRYHL